MCGFVFSTDRSLYHLNLDEVSSRGPDAANTLINDFGYFFHARLITRETNIKQPATNQHGILLYNGTEYDLSSNDVDHLINNLSSNIKNNIDFLKTLNGDFSICWVTEEHIIIAKDCFGTKPLFFGINNGNFIVSSSEVIIKSCNYNPIRLEQNTVLVLERKTLNLIVKQNIIDWNLNQGTTTIDDVFIQFEKSTLEKFHDNCLVKMSSGYDSGAIAACLNKHKKNYSIASYIGTENKEVLQKRFSLHTGKKTLYSYNSYRKKQDVRKLLPWDFVNKDDIVADIALIDCEFAIKNNINVIISGIGADELYSDYGFNGIKIRHVSLFGGKFTDDLNLIWPYHDSKSYPLWADIPILDYVNGLHGIDSRHPFLDRRLFQTWLNTSVDMKNKSYKHWMAEYLKLNNYPYEKNEKIGMGNNPINF